MKLLASEVADVCYMSAKSPLHERLDDVDFLIVMWLGLIAHILKLTLVQTLT